MKQACKHLKVSSYLVLILAAMNVLQLLAELFYGDLNAVELPAGSPENILLITRIILLAVSLLLMLPRIHVGVKGLKVAEHPDDSKGHIVWAIIIFVLALVDLMEPVVGLVKQEDIGNNVGGLLSILLEVLVYFDYIKYALAVRNAKKK